MDNNYNRLYKLSLTMCTVLFITSGLSHVTSYFHKTSSTGLVKFASVRDITENKNLKSDQANILFELSADFTSEFDWNLNQLFVFVVAEYSTEHKSRNEVTIWDAIIRDKSEAVIERKVYVNEYPLRDQYRKTLLGTDVTLKVYYHRMPIMGFILKYQLTESEPFTLPKEYFRVK